ncbi:kinesin-like protein KIN-12E isoform X2 [Chenopodium quinoa]|uniref:kinesin-like protein KIN-12E isoform X2 n=1 Tax=Chenopodium quinoa TaxID=63459 RepID=UPI000B7899EE|nr:kinesin-like protein KIN-12E isoform X2 [Chenopodium quinoa]
MFKIPFFSETPSSVKTRTGFHDPPESARATPSIAKSMSRDNLLQSSTVRNFNDREEFLDSANNALVVRSFDLPEDPSFWKDHNVQVIIRLRPLNNSEISLQGQNRCVRQESSQSITWTGHPESRFTFDVVADENVTQEKLFKVAGVPMVENCVAGYNSCMFAYGQTGSGKTHTMLGDIEGGTRRHSIDCGMTPRVFEHLFSRIQKEKEARREEKYRFTCKCSFLEIYNEQILDLLNPSSTNLQIREDLKKGIHVENLTELEVTSARDVMQQLLQGAANRKVAATNMNRASSRSHSVFTCVIESTWESQGVTHHRFARLNLVDLAGSERQKSSGAEGDRLKEATNINKSLSTLGLVIMNLVSISNGKSHHVPYRDSKLTFLLQDSLGGNAKTTIIANISPSSCCSLETLSTLKFAQRAKFIKNNAIVNEDASGDVLAMRMQIQQLKKEVSHLRSLQNGGAGNQDNDAMTLGFLGSPGAFKWEGLNGSVTPLTSNKRLSQKKEIEVALVGAFRREKDKDMALQALTAENQAAMQLAKQRQDEIQGLKMRLRFREAGIKRLEAVASGKISAETHLLKEKEEHLKEIEVLRAQVNKNQEVTRFAMENLRLKEEIRRLQSFCEEGERERMIEQINTLQNKLLEALDWKLMHESEPSNAQKRSPCLLTDSPSDLDQLNFNKESASPWQSSIKEENEFLRVQAIQNQAEIDSLRKKLNSFVEAKEKLERHIKDLEAELQEVRSSINTKEESHQMQADATSTTTNDMNNNDQQELKAMVDVIAAASQREAEAHEMAIILAKENDELRAKIKVLLEDNSKLIDLYERAAAETSEVNNVDAQGNADEGQNTGSGAISQIKDAEIKRLEDLEHQLAEMHDENEKLMSLYEKAMQEKDDIKRLLSSAVHNNTAERGEFEFPEKLVEVDGGKYLESSECFAESSSGMKEQQILSADTVVLEETDTSKWNVQNTCGQCPPTPFTTEIQMDVGLDEIQNIHEQRPIMEENSFGTCVQGQYETGESNVLKIPPMCITSMVSKEKCSFEFSSEDTYIQCPGDSQDDLDTRVHFRTYSETVTEEELVLVKKELEKARERLSSSAHTVSEFETIEKAVLLVDAVSREIDALKGLLQFKQQEIGSLKPLSSEMQDRSALVFKKLAALKVSISSISSSVAYFEQREDRAKARVDASMSSLGQQKENLVCLQVQSDEINAKRREIQETEVELRNNLWRLKSKLEEENQKQESQRVLLAIDNIERTEAPALICSKATDLLKSEEEKTKLQNEIKQTQEKLGVIKKQVDDLNRKGQKLDSEIQVKNVEMQKTTKLLQERGLALQNVTNEKAMLLEMKENGKPEIDEMIVEYQQCSFEEHFREEELMILEEDMYMLSLKLAIFESEREVAVKRATQLLYREQHQTGLPSERMRQELEDVQKSILEANTLLLAEKPADCQVVLSASSHRNS